MPELDTSFAGLLRLVFSPDMNAAASIPQHFQRLPTGARLTLPIMEAAIDSTHGGTGRPALAPLPFLQGDGSGPVMARLNVIPVSGQRGKIAVGSATPTTSIQPEGGTANVTFGLLPSTPPAGVREGDLIVLTADQTGLMTTFFDEDGDAVTSGVRGSTWRYETAGWVVQDDVLRDVNFELSDIIETKSIVSVQSLLQANDDLSELVFEAHRIAIGDRLAERVISQVAATSDIGAFEYMMVNRGKDSLFLDGETAVEDARGRLERAAWALGADLHTSAMKTQIEPGSDRRVLERQRISLSSVPTQRVSAAALAGTSGLLADWGTVTQVVASEIEFVINRISRPGDVIVTSRYAVSPPIVSHVGTVYALTEA